MIFCASFAGPESRRFAVLSKGISSVPYASFFFSEAGLTFFLLLDIIHPFLSTDRRWAFLVIFSFINEKGCPNAAAFFSLGSPLHCFPLMNSRIASHNYLS